MNTRMNDPIETLRQKIDKHAFKKHLDAIQKTPTMMDILGVARDENSHSDFLAWLFDSNNDHGLGTKVVENLLSILDLNLNDNLKVSESKSSRECCIDNGRVDIIVELETNDQGKYRIVFENKIHAKETKGDQTQRYYDHYNNLKDNIQNIFVFNRYDIGQKPRCEKFKCITYQDIAEKVIKPIIDKKDANKLTKKILEDYLLTLEKPINNHILAMRTETKEKLRNFTTEILPILDIAVNALVQNTKDDDNSQLYKDLAKAVATLKNKSNYEVKLQLQSEEKQYTSLAEAAVFLVQTLANQFMDNSNKWTTEHEHLPDDQLLKKFESYIGKAEFFGNSTFLIGDGQKCSGTFPKKYSITLGGKVYKICTDWYTEENKKTKQFQKFLDVVLNKIGGDTKVVVTQNGNQIYSR